MAEKFIEGRVVGRRDYSDSLFALRFEADIEPFVAGQYCRLGLVLPPCTVEQSSTTEPVLTMRPYSLVNAPDERPHEEIGRAHV